MRKDAPMDYWPAIIAASAALAGTMIGTASSLLLSWLDRKHRRTATLLQKLEDVTAALRQTVEWREILEGTTAFEQTTSTHPATAFFPLESLVVLYFPRLQPAVSAYTEGLRLYHSWAIRHLVDGDLQPPELPPQTLIARLHVFDQTAVQDQSNKLRELHHSLANAIDREARRLLGSS